MTNPLLALHILKKIEGEQKIKVLGLSDKTVACLPTLLKLFLHELLCFYNFILFF
ncbi:hypothetical protein GCM10007358_17420 [Phocicoccus schoeneichii]|nr:hypothetical protein GCM10007358_17420 [Jeotgalicoccus schoeneichii]